MAYTDEQLKNDNISNEDLDREATDNGFSKHQWDLISIFQKLNESFLRKWKQFINWREASKHQTIPEDLLNDPTVSPDILWEEISLRQKLPMKFIKENADKVNILHQLQYFDFNIIELAQINWVDIAKNPDINENLLNKYSKQIDLSFVPWNRVNIDNFSDNFFIAKQKEINWDDLSINGRVSEDFIERHASRINWKKVSSRPLSNDFIKKHKDELDWGVLCRYQNLSEEIISEMDKDPEISSKLNWHVINKYQENLSEEFKNKNRDRLLSISDKQEEFNKNIDKYSKEQIEVINSAFEKGIDATKYADPKYSVDQLKQFAQIVEEKQHLESYLNENLDINQIKLIRAAEKMGVDPELLNNPNNSLDKINEIKNAIIDKKEIPKPEVPFQEALYEQGYSIGQIDQLNFGSGQGLDFSVYMNKNFTAKQMEQIRLGLSHHIDVKEWADPSINVNHMHFMRICAEHNQPMTLAKAQTFTSKQLAILMNAVNKDLNIKLIANATLSPKLMESLSGGLEKIKKIEKDFSRGYRNTMGNVMQNLGKGLDKVTKALYDKAKDYMNQPTKSEEKTMMSYNPDQNVEIVEAVKWNTENPDKAISMSLILDSNLSAAQMHEIRLALQSGLDPKDVEKFATPYVAASSMKQAFTELKQDMIHKKAQEENLNKTVENNTQEKEKPKSRNFKDALDKAREKTKEIATDLEKAKKEVTDLDKKVEEIKTSEDKTLENLKKSKDNNTKVDIKQEVKNEINSVEDITKEIKNRIKNGFKKIKDSIEPTVSVKPEKEIVEEKLDKIASEACGMMIRNHKAANEKSDGKKFPVIMLDDGRMLVFKPELLQTKNMKTDKEYPRRTTNVYLVNKNTYEKQAIRRSYMEKGENGVYTLKEEGSLKAVQRLLMEELIKDEISSGKVVKDLNGMMITPENISKAKLGIEDIEVEENIKDTQEPIVENQTSDIETESIEPKTKENDLSNEIENEEVETEVEEELDVKVDTLEDRITNLVEKYKAKIEDAPTREDKVKLLTDFFPSNVGYTLEENILTMYDESYTLINSEDTAERYIKTVVDLDYGEIVESTEKIVTEYEEQERPGFIFDGSIKMKAFNQILEDMHDELVETVSLDEKISQIKNTPFNDFGYDNVYSELENVDRNNSMRAILNDGR